MCGVVGIIGLEQPGASRSWASFEVYNALLTLQHRGQDSAGILSYDNSTLEFHSEKNKGLVSSVFDEEKLFKLSGNMAIGHNRYVTVGSDDKKNVQPIVTGIPYGIGITHNGNILNYSKMADLVQIEKGIQLITNNDIELILNLWCHNLIDTKSELIGFHFEHALEALRKVCSKIIGAYSVAGIIANRGMFAFRDPLGIRPLVLGKKTDQNGKITSYCLASETVAFNFLGYSFVREIDPGEFLFISKNLEIKSGRITPLKKSTPCMFEWVYFSGAESGTSTKSIYASRLELGKLLAIKTKKYINAGLINPDIVVPVPDTSRTAAISMSCELNIPYREALIKNRYVQRSFILNSKEKRERAVELKLAPVKSEIKGKNILLVDDSIVRGTTSKKIINLLNRYGAKSVTLASTCPPIRYPCYYGIDFPTPSELIASKKTIAEISDSIGANSVIYIDEQDLSKAIGKDDLCMACLNNSYPTCIKDGISFSKYRVEEQLLNSEDHL